MTFGLHVPGYVRRELAARGYQVAVEDLNKVPVFLNSWTDVPVVLLVHHLFGSTAFKEASFPVAAATWLLERPIPRAYRDVPVITVSSSTAEDLRRRGLDGAAEAIVYNGVSLDRLVPEPDGERFPDPSILYLGRLKRYKGVELILRAVARLRDEGNMTVRFLIAGKGDYEEKLRSLTFDLGLGDLVDFLGYVSEEEKVRLLQRAWVHVLTSPKEGWGISILEAAACGTPTVASHSPGLRDAVRHQETGLLVPHGDVDALCQALLALLSDRDARERMGRDARAFAEGFSWDSSARTMESFLNNRVAAVRSHG
jgi:glycosyltransferase involved in cell wall biosynthesis